MYYDIRSLKCISARLVSNVSALNATNKTVATGHYTLVNLQKQIKAQVVPTKVCPAATPLFNGSQCVACAPNQYYLIETLKCYTPVYSSNVAALTSSGTVVQVGGFNLNSLSASIAAQPFPTKPCPAATPFLSGGKCIGCPSGQYYDLKARSCYKPTFASNLTQLKVSHVAFPVGNHTLSALNKTITASPYPTVPCPRAAPIFNGSACTFCPPGTYYLLSNLSCFAPLLVSNVSALTATHKVLPYKGASLLTLAASISNITLPKVECNQFFPLFNGTNCVACPNGTYYLLNNKTCYVPQVVSNVVVLNSTKRVLNIGNATLTNLAANITASPFPVVMCPPSHPLFNGTACDVCPNGTYYLIKNSSCYTPGFASNISFLIRSKSYVNIGNFTLTNLNSTISASVYPVKSCPSSTPIFNGTNCQACPKGTYYLLNNYTCYHPKNVSNVSELAISHRYIHNANNSLVTI